MLLQAEIEIKTMGSKTLFTDLSMMINPGEKIGIIGRNGAGKSTLLGMLSGEDQGYSGEITKKGGITMVRTAQEHTEHISDTCVEYILSALPGYRELHHIIETYPAMMGSDMTKITNYSEALEKFEEAGYFQAEENVIKALGEYQIDEDKARGPLDPLSGGQKRFVELVKVQQSSTDIALIDEPTNHMDYVAKASFIAWLKATEQAMVIVTHDRDVLQHMDRMIEIKDKQAFSFGGNYDVYLKQNQISTVTNMSQYEVAQRTIGNVKKQIAYAKSRKAKWTGTADKKNPFVVMENRLMKELVELQGIEKPSFWIDEASMEELDFKATARYEKYKDKNVTIQGLDESHKSQQLLFVRDLELGYDGPLFEPVSFMLGQGERVELRGRNGVGKSTLVRAVQDTIGEKPLRSQPFAGEIERVSSITMGVYEQEVSPEILKHTLGEAVHLLYEEKETPIVDQKVRQLLAGYLFDASADYDLPVSSLSGGQKARLQIMGMLANKPNLLILDEPTNHLDLPSIEELEKALVNFEGAILYVSHDSYFTAKLAGQRVDVLPSTKS